ncbi:hypothetical protein ELB20_60 [Streptomyces phage phiELB20]|uniref:Uncharacterized protein n=1 Tax=Streptomyces phage phiELB20 TaxID=1211278 RepID=I7A9L0_9CAUD|nr:hypothetical protein FDG59_gp24 [Streptomyces phage phiELB20]AFO10926.1 hypothetical protein ELB20_60 [Streptomyces phage phiELB20]
MSNVNSQIRALIKKYRAEEGYREAHVAKYRGEDGEPLPGKTREHDQACTDNAYETMDDHDNLLLELAKLVGPELEVGTAVIVPAGAITVDGSAVNFEGEVTGEVYELEDSDGDVLVRSGGLLSYVDPRQLKLVE